MYIECIHLCKWDALLHFVHILPCKNDTGLVGVQDRENESPVVAGKLLSKAATVMSQKHCCKPNNPGKVKRREQEEEDMPESWMPNFNGRLQHLTIGTSNMKQSKVAKSK